MGSSLGNRVNVVYGLSVFFVAALILFSSRRKATVGECLIFPSCLVLQPPRRPHRNSHIYLLTLPLQLLTTGSLVQQGTKAPIVLTSIHAGLVAAMFWGLLANALMATQIEDGTLSSLIVRPFSLLSLRSFGYSGAGLMWERTAVLFLHTRILRSDAVHLARHRAAYHQRIRPV